MVQLPPFEVIGGSHPGDLVTTGKRFFQYDYRLRLINEDGFGADVEVPQLEDQLPHREQGDGRRVGAGSGPELRAAAHLDPAVLDRARRHHRHS